MRVRLVVFATEFASFRHEHGLTVSNAIPLGSDEAVRTGLPAPEFMNVPGNLVAEGVPALDDDDLTIDERIKGEDAKFRREFAGKLFWLFAAAVAVGPIFILAATIIELLYPANLDLPTVLDKATLLATSIIGTVAGVFGTVMGFYYGSEKK